LLIGTNRHSLTGRYPQSTPDPEREELLNQLCKLREDPRFGEWCRLTSALGLGSLPLAQLAALHADTAEAIFPEIGEWEGGTIGDFARYPFDVTKAFGFDGRNGARDMILGDGIATTWPAAGVPAPGTGIPEAALAMNEGLFDGHFGDSPAHDGRGE
jgi:hypothetical protein